MRWLRIIVIASLLALGCWNVPCHAGEPSENKWGPFSGRVVDAETGEPVPGAIFVVIWMRSIPTPAHAAEHFNDARMAVADTDGRFEIPRRDPPWLSFLIENPYLACVAPGYAAATLDVGRQRNPPISIRLRHLTARERELHGNGWAPELGLIPYDMRAEFGTLVNTKRQQMGLGSVNLTSGAL